jgi:hypothetical protein
VGSHSSEEGGIEERSSIFNIMDAETAEADGAEEVNITPADENG